MIICIWTFTHAHTPCSGFVPWGLVSVHYHFITSLSPDVLVKLVLGLDILNYLQGTCLLPATFLLHPALELHLPSLLDVEIFLIMEITVYVFEHMPPTITVLRHSTSLKNFKNLCNSCEGQTTGQAT